MKIEVGMYARTDRGKIGKFHKELREYYELEYPQNVCDLVFKSRVIKASHNIIDLIEIGDYVNGYKVIEIGYEEDGHKYLDLDFDRENDALHWGQSSSIEYDELIKSIVTKEQFKSISYKVEEVR